MEELHIQWYPGHMTKARRMMEENLHLVDALCEIVDARIPASSRNPDIDVMAAGKPRLMVLNRVDQADPAVTARWSAWFREQGILTVETDCQSGKGTRQFVPALRELLKERTQAYAAKGQTGRVLRCMVAGIPNVGKSSLINRVAGRRAAEASDRPGVTRGKQWITICPGVELLDTPGILWPKFEDPGVAMRLAFTGAIKDQILDVETLGANLMLVLRDRYPRLLSQRYKLPDMPEGDGFALLKAAGRKRGYLISGGEIDTERMAGTLLDEFRGGKLGRISLEEPEL